MKTIAVSLLALGLFAGTANARSAKDFFTDLSNSAPRSAFDQIRDSAPLSPFDQIRDSAPRTVFDDIRDSSPRSDGVFGDLQNSAP
jgi:hypothetical protein